MIFAAGVILLAMMLAGVRGTQWVMAVLAAGLLFLFLDWLEWR